MGQLSGIARVFIGGMGGAVAVISKYLAQDHASILRWLELGDQIKIQNLLIGYAILAPCLIFLGAFVAWVSDEHQRLKLAAIAVSAPALITTWAGGATSATKLGLNLIDSAYAQEKVLTVHKTGQLSVIDGLKLFFGIGKDDDSKTDVVTGTSTKVYVNGAASDRDSIKSGMICTVVGPAGGQATKAACE